MIGKLNHVAIAVPDLEAAIKTYESVLGALVSDKIEQKDHGVVVAFIKLPNTQIELITPFGEESPIKKFMELNPNGGIHHICYEVKNINESKKILLRTGARLAGNGEPKIGAHGKSVIFLHPKDFHGALIELQEI